MFPIFKKAYKEDLTEDDLYRPLWEHKSENVGSELEKYWYREYGKRKKRALLRALVKLFGLKYAMYGIVKFVGEIMLIVVIPMCIGKIVLYFESGETRISRLEVYAYSGGLVLCLFTDSVLSQPAYMGMQHIAMKVRVGCSALVYRKLLKFNRTALMGTTVGQLVNLLSNDVSKFDEAFMLAHFAWIGPIQVAVGTYLLYREIGYGAFCGVAFLCSFVPFQIWLAQKTSVIRLRTALRTDERVRLMNEIITGIQVIKMYCWEKSFSQLVNKARGAEVKQILRHSYIIGIIYSFEIFICRTSIFISVLGYVLLGNYVTAEKVFAVTAIYNCLRPIITMLFSLSIAAIAEIYISILRIQNILEFEEFTRGPLLLDENNQSRLTPEDNNTPRVIFENVCARWVEEASEDTISNISFNVSSNMLLAIIGPVGGGKSSIFNVILGELPIRTGTIDIVGTISYSSQEPWLFASTVRDNILFGEQFNAHRYQKVVHACALKQDFSSLPFGDRTLVGERGKALSGGQKARISLARCVYKKADIYLLDDPLSAVDAKVGKHLYEQCIKSFLSNTICILVTHQLQFLKDADKIIILDNGQIEIIGNYDEIKSSGRDFAQMMQSFQEEDEKEKKRLSRHSSFLGYSEEIEDQQTIDKEFLESGNITMGTYLTYLKAGGNIFSVTFLLLLFIGCQVLANGGEYFLTYWVNLEQDYGSNNSHHSVGLDDSDLNRKKIIILYSALTIATIAVGVVKSVYFMTFLTVASKNLHNMMYSKVQYATMKFYDTNPSGRILNRFSKDLGTVDEYIPSVLIDVLEISLQLVGVIILSSLVEPYLLLVAFILLVVFYLIRVVYVKTSRNVKRLEAITKSPMFSHMTATMYGLDTIRAFAAEEQLIQQFDDLQDVHSSAWFLYIASGKCFALWLDITCQFFIAIALFTLLSINSDIHGGDMGLVLTQYIGLMGSLQWGMRQWTELENNMTSVERILEYGQLDTDPIREKTPNLKKEWPEKGQIEFREVSLQYTTSDPYVLRELNFLVKPTEKIGIVGRTGAGKSSTITALFQLYPIQGSIIIDNMDTTLMPLDIVRSKISIIPQAPFLFSGSMRENLDPFEEYPDDVLWNALEQVDLKEDIEEFPSGLGTMVSEGGNNFSVGQRQLVCLARALIRNNKILVLDEATANVDPHTDSLIQATIRDKFAHCTVLTIAHRLHTVMDADKILVMDHGTVQEFDHPHILLQREDGILRNLVDATGSTTARYLETIAEETEKKHLNETPINLINYDGD